jgi:hypothetical protein
MKHKGARLLFTVFSCLLLLLPFSAAAQTGGSDRLNFVIALKLRRKVWETQNPLAVDIIFRNKGRRSFYVANKCEFGFEGYLNQKSVDGATLRYYVKWNDGTQNCTPSREDFIKVSPGKSVRVRLNSVSVESLGNIPWTKHPRGWYTLSVRYKTSKAAPFEGVWLGSAVSNEARLFVR